MNNKTFERGVSKAQPTTPFPPSRRMAAFRRTSAVPAENNTRSRRGTAAPRRKSGAVQMEYVILAVLIAAASVVAVIVFGRSVVSSFLTASDAATLEHTKARDGHHQRQQDRADDQAVSKDYHDAMHQ